MKNLRNYLCALSIVLGVSMIESTGVWFWVALALVFVPLAVLAFPSLKNAWKKYKAYRIAKRNCENIDYLTDCVIFGELEMNN